MRNLRALIGAISLVTFTTIGYQNCGGNLKAHPQISEKVIQGELIQSAKFECQYIGADTLMDRLSTFLGIEEKDVPILDDKGNPTSKFRIKSSLSSLGVADLKAGKYTDYSCEMIKFKISTEVMIDACAKALSDDSIKNQLFPNGEDDYSQLYLNFVGRLPTVIEEQILNDLASSVSEQHRGTAICSATAMSFEALTRI